VPQLQAQDEPSDEPAEPDESAEPSNEESAEPDESAEPSDEGGTDAIAPKPRTPSIRRP
jgi:hypothetical protein